jgi:hypothetical protein
MSRTMGVVPLNDNCPARAAGGSIVFDLRAHPIRSQHCVVSNGCEQEASMQLVLFPDHYNPATALQPLQRKV